MKWNEIIRGLREDRDLTQTSLAKILHTNQRTISNWEAGRNQPPYEVLILYAKYFNVSIDYILGLSEEPTSKKTIRNQLNINGGKNRIENINMN